MFGYMGKLLRVNLTNKKITEEPLDAGMAHDFIGGAGLGTRLMWDEVPGDTDPLSPANKLMFLTGPVTATIFPSTARYEVCTKSPLTGLWLDASSSGKWGNLFKRTGYDGIIIEGASDKPVYLWITDDHCEIKDASHLWGKDAMDTQDIIKKELGEKRASVACIGPAGEKQVLLACIVNDSGRVAGRGGAGAVMGSKKLKAIAVNGSKKVEVAMEDYLKYMAKEYIKGFSASPASLMMGKWGTAASLDSGWASGDVPVKNWKLGIWKEGSVKLGGKRMADTILSGQDACLGCFIRCARHIKIDQGKYAMDTAGPEYETLCMFGTMLMNDDLESVCMANELCNRVGIDTISAGSTMAWAMEAYEKGLITKADTGGIDLKWGNIEGVLEIIKLIGENKGIGALLGMGTRKASQKIGKGSEDFAVQVNGMEVPAHDPRAFFSMAVNYATGPRGACHLHGMPFYYEMGMALPEAGIYHKQGRFDRDGKGLAAKLAQDLASIPNSAVVCAFVALGLSPTLFGNLLMLATGIPYSGQDMIKTGERIVNLQRMFNISCGLTAANDKLPKRLLEATAEGGQKGRVPDIAHQLKEYYKVRGWTEKGIPTDEKLKELNLEFAIGGQKKAAAKK